MHDVPCTLADASVEAMPSVISRCKLVRLDSHCHAVSVLAVAQLRWKARSFPSSEMPQTKGTLDVGSHCRTDPQLRSVSLMTVHELSHRIDAGQSANVEADSEGSGPEYVE